MEKGPSGAIPSRNNGGRSLLGYPYDSHLVAKSSLPRRSLTFKRVVCLNQRQIRLKNSRGQLVAYPEAAFPTQRLSSVGKRDGRLASARHIDLNSGFWQIPMEEESKPYTAFTVGSYGFYQFERMPFGLCNAPTTFQHCMQECLGELNLNYCLIYMDDIVVYARTLQDHLYRLWRVFDRFREHRLKLKPSKCAFFKEEITYLGHRVSAEGVKPATINIDKILEKRPPRTYTEIREFLGMVNHYRRFIKDCSKISRPLTAYTKGEGSKRKTEEVRLEPEALGAFQQLKEALTEAPVLAYADFTQPFLLENDASSQGLGAVLSQKKEDGRFHPVAYGSRSLAKEEKNYHSTKLEFLALYWAVTQQFKDYLWGRAFTVKTDNNPLTYIMSSAHLDATRHRWVGNLASYTFNLEYQKGKHNVVADTLSRYVSVAR